ncbi:MAG: 50S ribosomal protein L15 [Spirochaetia bacterium]|jgi:large subunit ribosomal protein L15|nr:50S ribosomal protein L15 [Spirochaetales bacterium]
MDIVKPKGATTRAKVLGRGRGTGKGGTAGKGTKGQNSRSGGGTRLGFEGGQMPLYRRIARRGFSNYPFKKEFLILKVEALNVFKDGDTVNRDSLIAKGLIRAQTHTRKTPIKILGNGTIEKKLTVAVDKVTSGAAEKIKAAGGTITPEKNEA